jgi:anthranilate phosphoribosyltransferase
MLGPLTNPAGATAQLIGVYDPKLTEMFAGVLRNLGTKRAFIVHGADGLDEATVTGPTRFAELKEGLITTYDIDPMELFGGIADSADLRGGDAEANARITTEILNGETGARRRIVVFNAALAIVAGGRSGTIKEGIAVAEGCIDSGAALKKLRGLIEHSHS